MSRSLGPLLPDRLLGRLLDPAAVLDRAVVLATVDPYGWPYPALLSYGEMAALDAGRIRLAVGADSRSGRHLRDSGRATLVFVDPELTLYVQADGVALPPARGHRGLARFELLVRDVREDRTEGDEAGARVTAGITIAWPDGPAGAARRHARRRRALLA